MVRTRWDYLQREHSQTASTGTKMFELPKKGFMPNLLLDVGMTPTGNSAQPQSVSECITKMEILDGGKVIKSLTGNQMKALSMFHGHNPLCSTEINDGAVAGHDQFYIVMGGVYNGKRYAPDMSRFENPQLHLTWDSADTTTRFGVTTTTDSAPALLVSLLAELTNAAGPYIHGYVKSSLVKQFSQTTNTTTHTTIPEHGNLIGFALEAGYDALDWTEDIQELKLDVNNGEWVPFYLREKQVPTFQQLIFKKPFQYSFITDVEDQEELDTHMGYLAHLSALSTGVGDDPLIGEVFSWDPTHKGVETLRIHDASTPVVCDEMRTTMLQATGWIPFQTWYCPSRFLNGGENDLLDTFTLGKMDVEMLSGGNASTSSKPAVLAEYLKT